jgi:DUF1009 family protein
MHVAAPITRSSNANRQTRLRVGLLAGWGRYPIVVAEALARSGYFVCGLGAKDHADPALETICDEFCWFGLGKLGRAIRYFERKGCHNATMAGKIHKVRLYQRFGWLRHFPDFTGLLVYGPYFMGGKKDLRDDTLLTAVVDAFSARGIHFAPATDYAPELLVKPGQLTRRGPTAAERKDIEFGWKLAKEMGRLDIGQSVVVKDRTPIAVEAIEGTDECIRRGGMLCSGGFTVVKTAKPRQDMRFDVPTVGLGTLESIHSAGGKVLAIEAGRTVLIDEPKFIEFADRHSLVVVALDGDGNPTDVSST